MKEKREKRKNALRQKRSEENEKKEENTQSKETNVKTENLKGNGEKQKDESYLPIHTYEEFFPKFKYNSRSERRPKNLIPF